MKVPRYHVVDDSNSMSNEVEFKCKKCTNATVVGHEKTWTLLIAVLQHALCITKQATNILCAWMIACGDTAAQVLHCYELFAFGLHTVENLIPEVFWMMPLLSQGVIYGSTVIQHRLAPLEDHSSRQFLCVFNVKHCEEVPEQLAKFITTCAYKSKDVVSCHRKISIVL